MFRFLIAFSLALWALPSTAQDFPAPYRVVSVAEGDVLNVRAEPHAEAEPLGGLAPGASVEVVTLSENGRWGLVNLDERAGWASMRYLEAGGEPGWRSGEVPLSCLGTEPFWRLDLHLPTHHAEFFWPEEPGGFELVADTANLSRTEFPPTLAAPLSGMREGVAVLRGAQCSDGMSDRAFGIQTQIYWRGEESGLSGCCHLMR